MTERMLPQSEYRVPIIRVLLEMGGKGERFAILERLEKRLSHRFTDADYDFYEKSDQVIWEVRASWERVAMIKDEILKKRARHGWWELSDSFLEDLARLAMSPKPSSP